MFLNKVKNLGTPRPLQPVVLEFLLLRLQVILYKWINLEFYPSFSPFLLLKNSFFSTSLVLVSTEFSSFPVLQGIFQIWIVLCSPLLSQPPEIPQKYHKKPQKTESPHQPCHQSVPRQAGRKFGMNITYPADP